MSADGRYGVGMRWLVLTPSPSPASLERGDQSRAQGRANAVQATVARMFCPSLNPSGRGMGKPDFPFPQLVLGRLRPGRRGQGETGLPQVLQNALPGTIQP